jgi:hypothetical protein
MFSARPRYFTWCCTREASIDSGAFWSFDLILQSVEGKRKGERFGEGGRKSEKRC